MPWYSLHASLLALLHAFNSSTYKSSGSARTHSTSSVFSLFLCLAVVPSLDGRATMCHYSLHASRSIQNSGSIDLLAHTPCVNVETHWSVCRALSGEEYVQSCSTWAILTVKTDLCYLQIFNRYHHGPEIGYTVPLWDCNWALYNVGTLIALKSVCGVDVGSTVGYARTLNLLDIHYSNRTFGNLTLGTHANQLACLESRLVRSHSKWVHCMIDTSSSTQEK